MKTTKTATPETTAAELKLEKWKLEMLAFELYCSGPPRGDAAAANWRNTTDADRQEWRDKAFETLEALEVCGIQVRVKSETKLTVAFTELRTIPATVAYELGE
jgi:hypothetical protein